MAEFDTTEYTKWVEALRNMRPEVPDFRDPAKLQAEQDFLQDYFGATDYAAQDSEARRMRNLQIGLSLMGRGFGGAGEAPRRGEAPLAAFGRSVVSPLASDLMGITGQDYQNRMARQAAQAQEKRALKLSALQNVQQREGAAYEQEVQLGQAAMELMRKDSTLLENLTYDGERMPIVQQIDSFGNPSFRSIGGQKLDPTLIRVYTEGTKPRDALFSTVAPREGNIWYALRDGEWVPNVDVQRGRVFTEAEPVIGESFLQDTQTNQRLYTSGPNKNLEQRPPTGVGDSKTTYEDATDYYRVDEKGTRLTRSDVGLPGGNVPLTLKTVEQVVGDTSSYVDLVRDQNNAWVDLKKVLGDNEELINKAANYSSITVPNWQAQYGPSASGTGDPKGIKKAAAVANAIKGLTQFQVLSSRGSFGDAQGVTINPKAVSQYLAQLAAGNVGLYEQGEGPALFVPKIPGVALSPEEQSELDNRFRNYFVDLTATDTSSLNSQISNAVKAFANVGLGELGLAGQVVTQADATEILKKAAKDGDPFSNIAEGIDLNNIPPNQRANYSLAIAGKTFPFIFDKNVNASDNDTLQERLDIGQALAKRFVPDRDAPPAVNKANLVAAVDQGKKERRDIQESVYSRQVNQHLVRTLNVLERLDELEGSLLKSGGGTGLISGSLNTIGTKLGWTDAATVALVGDLKALRAIMPRIQVQEYEGRAARISDQDVKAFQDVVNSILDTDDVNYDKLLRLRRVFTQSVNNIMHTYPGEVAFSDDTIRRVMERGSTPVRNLGTSYNWYNPAFKQTTTAAFSTKLPAMTDAQHDQATVRGFLNMIASPDRLGEDEIILPLWENKDKKELGRVDDKVFTSRGSGGVLRYGESMSLKQLSNYFDKVVEIRNIAPGERTDDQNNVLDTWHNNYWPRIRALYGPNSELVHQYFAAPFNNVRGESR